MAGGEKELRRILDSRDPPEVQHLVVAVLAYRGSGVKAGKINTLLHASLHLVASKDQCARLKHLYIDTSGLYERINGCWGYNSLYPG